MAHRLLLGLALVAVFLSAGGLAYYLHFYRHKGGLDESLAGSQSALQSYQDWLESRPSAEDKLKQFAAAWTLGFNSEVVDSRFRSGLTRMAESAGLVPGKIVVTPAQKVTQVKNPIVDRNGVAEFRRFASQEAMAEPDIFLRDADLRGSGTIGAVTRLLALAQTQPWIWRVGKFTLKPLDTDATMFDITLSVSTAWMPDLAPPPSTDGDGNTMPVDAPQIIDPTADEAAELAAIVRRNVFAPPAVIEPTVVVTQGSTEVDPVVPPGERAGAAPPPPYHEWRLTGVSGSPGQGRLAWMLNVRTGSAVLLHPGQGVLDAVLVRAEGSEAVFQIGGTEYSLALNETLADLHHIE